MEMNLERVVFYSQKQIACTAQTTHWMALNTSGEKLAEIVDPQMSHRTSDYIDALKQFKTNDNYQKNVTPDFAQVVQKQYFQYKTTTGQPKPPAQLLKSYKYHTVQKSQIALPKLKSLVPEQDDQFRLGSRRSSLGATIRKLAAEEATDFPFEQNALKASRRFKVNNGQLSRDKEDISRSAIDKKVPKMTKKLSEWALIQRGHGRDSTPDLLRIHNSQSVEQFPQISQASMDTTEKPVTEIVKISVKQSRKNKLNMIQMKHKNHSQASLKHLDQKTTSTPSRSAMSKKRQRRKVKNLHKNAQVSICQDDLIYVDSTTFIDKKQQHNVSSHEMNQSLLGLEIEPNSYVQLLERSNSMESRDPARFLSSIINEIGQLPSRPSKQKKKKKLRGDGEVRHSSVSFLKQANDDMIIKQVGQTSILTAKKQPVRKNLAEKLCSQKVLSNVYGMYDDKPAQSSKSKRRVKTPSISEINQDAKKTKMINLQKSVEFTLRKRQLNTESGDDSADSDHYSEDYVEYAQSPVQIQQDHHGQQAQLTLQPLITFQTETEVIKSDKISNDGDCNQKEDESMKLIKDGNLENGHSSQPVRMKQTAQNNSQRLYELHNLTQSSSLIDQLIKKAGAKSPNRTEQIQIAKQASAFLSNKLPRQMALQQSPRTAEQSGGARKKVMDSAVMAKTQTTEQIGEDDQRNPLRQQLINEVLNEEDSCGTLKKLPIEMSEMEQKHSRVTQSYSNQFERNRVVGSSSSTHAYNWMERGQSQVIASSQEGISRQLKDAPSLYSKQGLKSSSKAQFETKSSPPKVSATETSGLPAIRAPLGQRNVTKVGSMMTSKTKKDNQTTWGAEWPVPALIDKKQEPGSMKSKRRQEVTDHVNNLPLSSFSFRTTDFKTSNERPENQKLRSALPSSIMPGSATANQQASPGKGTSLRMKSINGFNSGATDQRKTTMLAKKQRVTGDQKVLQASFFFQDQDQNLKTKTKLKRRDRQAQPTIEEQLTSIEVSVETHKTRKVNIDNSSEERNENKVIEQDIIMKTIDAQETTTPKQQNSQKVGLIVKAYTTVQKGSEKRRVFNQKIDTQAKHNQASLKNGASVSPIESSTEQLMPNKAIQFGSPKNFVQSATICKAQRTSVGFANNNTKTKIRAAIYINGSLGALNNKSPQMHVLENRMNSSAQIGFNGPPHITGSGKTSLRKQQVKDLSYLSAQRVRENKKLQQQSGVNMTTITSDNSNPNNYQLTYQKKQQLPDLKSGTKLNKLHMDDAAAQVYTNYHANVQQNSAKKQLIDPAGKTNYRRKLPAAVARESSTSYGNFDRFPTQDMTNSSQVTHPQNALDRVTLHEQLTDMIFKNVSQLTQQEINTRDIAREKQIIRDSLKGKSIEEMAKIEEQARSDSKLVEKQSNFKTQKNQEKRTQSAMQDNSLIEASVDAPQTRTEQLSRALQEKKSSTIVLSYRSQDKWLKRAALARGWIENSGNGSHLFNVKWEYSDSQQDVYKNLRSNQFYNHFPDSRELTTKQGLNQNLHQITAPGVDIYSFYPRCYDLSDQRQVDLFKDDFNRTAILCCLKKHARYFKNQCRDMMKEIEAKDNLILDNKWKEENKRQLKRSYIGNFPPEKSIEKVNTILLRNAIFYARSLLLLDQDCEGDEFIKNNYYQPNFQFNQRILNIVVKYAELDVPMKPEELEMKTNTLTTIEEERELILAYYDDVLKFRGWEIPNVYVMYQAYKIHKELKKKYPQYGQIDGTDNVWISKPSFTARGVGIFCFRSLRELFNGNAKKQMCPKIVQKYVERSFLLDKHGLPQLSAHTGVELRNHGRKTSISPTKMLSAASPNRRAHNVSQRKSIEEVGETIDMRKFDIRQWVYVNSFDPLSVFIYKKTYLRICGAHFDLSQFEDQQRHISNFSVQKDNELVLSSDDFIAYLKRLDPVKYADMSWDNFFLPQIDQIVKQTLTQMAEVIESRQNSFELYGFDFVVDKDLRLWLIEVNMSPACAERKPWLIEMLDDMATGLVNMILAKVNAHKDSLETTTNNMMTNFNQIVSAQDSNQNKKLYTKLQKQNLVTAIKGTNWIPMSKCDGFILTSGDKEVKVKVPQSQQQINVNPNNFEKQQLEVIGKKANLKMEKYLNYTCQRIAAALFIQKLYRGHLVRNKLLQEKQLKVKAATNRKKSVRIITENLQLAFDRIQNQDKRQVPFNELRMLSYDKLSEELAKDPAKLIKIVQLQRLARGWLSKSRILTISQPNSHEILDADVSNIIPHEDHQVTSSQQEEPILLTGTKRRHPTNHHMSSQDGSVNGDYDKEPSLDQLAGRNNIMAGMHSNNTIHNYGDDVSKSKTSINFHTDNRIVRRSSQQARSGTSANFKSTCSIDTQSASISVNCYPQKQTIDLEPPQTPSQSIIASSKNVRKTEPTKKPKSREQIKVVQRQQLDSYLLLDYRAVGVDLLIPLIELEKSKKLRAYASKVQSTTTAAAGEPRASSIGHSSKYRYRQNQVNNNFAFSPRFDCQQSAQVNFVSQGKNDRTQAQSSTLRDELAKRAHQAKKVKNQIMLAYVDNKVRVQKNRLVRE